MPPNVGARRGDLQGTPRQQDVSFTPTSTSLWLPPEAPQFPGVGGGGGPPQECVCLCHQAHRAHGSSPRTPWPRGTLCQLSLLSWPSFSSDQSCFAPAVQERQRRRRFPASSVTRAGTDVAVARARRRRAGPPSARKGSLQPPLCSGRPSCRIPFFLLPFFRTPCQSSKPRLKVSLLAGCLLSPQARLIFPLDGLLQSCVHPLLRLFALHQNKSLLYLSLLLDSLLLENESFLPHPRR